MNIKTLRERIEKAKEKIIKKQGTIARKNKTIENKEKLLTKLGVDNPHQVNKMDYARHGAAANMEVYWLLGDIENLKDDITRLEGEIEETKATLDKYNEQLKEQDEELKTYKEEVPQVFKSLEEELVVKWDAWDLDRKKRIKTTYNKLGYSDFFKSFTRADYDLMYKTDEQIHNENVKDARDIIMNLFYRTKEITGKVKAWDNISLDYDNQGFSVLNGRVIGEDGTAYVESILAGGYNIQRLHIRVLVKSL